MPRRFPMDYPFGPKYIEINGIIFGALLAGIGLALGFIIGRMLL